MGASGSPDLDSETPPSREPSDLAGRRAEVVELVMEGGDLDDIR